MANADIPETKGLSRRVDPTAVSTGAGISSGIIATGTLTIGLAFDSSATTTEPPTSVFSSITTGNTNTHSVASSTVTFSSSSPTSSSSIPTSSSSTSPISSSLYAVVGFLVAAIVLLVLFILLFLGHRCRQRKNRHPAEIGTSTPTPFRFSMRERPRGYVSVDDGPSSGSTTGVSSLPMTATATVHSSQKIPPAPNPSNTFSTNLRGKLGARFTPALQPPIQNGRIHLATTDPSPDSNQGQFQLNLSNAFITDDTTREATRAFHAPTYISNPSETHRQTALISISTDPGHGPDSVLPTYSNRHSHTNYTTREERASRAPTYISDLSEPHRQPALTSISTDSGHSPDSVLPAYYSSRHSHTNSSQLKS